MRSPGSAGRVLDRLPTPNESFLSSSTPELLPYRDFSSTIVHRDSLITADKDSLDVSNNIFLTIIHPYDTDAFEHFISKHNLTYSYSLLVTNLRNGFPLGEMPPLIDTVIFKNHPSTLLHFDVINKYLADELDAGRMSGPFSLQTVERILRGAIFCSPLLISIQTQQPGMPDKLRVCRHLSKSDKKTPSMNSHIHKEDFPTRFDTASRVADIVGSLPTNWRLNLQPSSSVYMGSLLVTLFFTSFTSGGSLTFRVSPLVAQFLMGFTSGGSILHGLHLWWLNFPWASPLVALLHELHLW